MSMQLMVPHGSRLLRLAMDTPHGCSMSTDGPGRFWKLRKALGEPCRSFPQGQLWGALSRFGSSAAVLAGLGEALGGGSSGTLLCQNVNGQLKSSSQVIGVYVNILLRTYVDFFSQNANVE